MPIRIIAQTLTSGSPETESTTKAVSLEPSLDGLFSHKLLGAIAIGEVNEVVGGATITFHFGGSFNTDAWPYGAQSGSLLLKALDQELVRASNAQGKFSPGFPQVVKLTNFFLRYGDNPQEFNIMAKTGPDTWQEISKIQMSFSQ